MGPTFPPPSPETGPQDLKKTPVPFVSLTALEALLNVLSPVADAGDKKRPDDHLQAAANDFQALEKLRRLAFSDEVPAPREEQRLLDFRGALSDDGKGS